METKREEFLALLGKRITKLRSEKKMTLEKLAYEVGISKGNLSDIEHGRKNPTYLTLQKIAQGLDISLSQLVRFL
jgi:transcriptional regulator with XRE-family HTH domain